MATAYFEPDLFRFLQDLKRNNRRDWFDEHKPRFEAAVKGPLLRFIADFDARIRTLSKHYHADARPSGGSMFRLHRDTRFSKDKSPYKTNAAAHFPHRAAQKDVHTPGFYLHLEPGNSMGGGGLWQPDTPVLNQVRDRIVEHSKDWKEVVSGRITILGDSLKRPPAGYDPDHPFVDDLKRKEFYVMTEFTDRQVCAPDFMDRYLKACRTAGPLVRFMAKAVGLPW
ncbi:MAG: DUF2461 domain-containing protein [Candidatus Methylomirabilaceae bacterium]